MWLKLIINCCRIAYTCPALSFVSKRSCSALPRVTVLLCVSTVTFCLINTFCCAPTCATMCHNVNVCGMLFCARATFCVAMKQSNAERVACCRGHPTQYNPTHVRYCVCMCMHMCWRIFIDLNFGVVSWPVHYVARPLGLCLATKCRIQHATYAKSAKRHKHMLPHIQTKICVCVCVFVLHQHLCANSNAGVL